MTTNEINAALGKNQRTFRITGQNGCPKAEVLATGVRLGPMYGNRRGGVRVKLLVGPNAGTEKVIQSRNVERTWTDQDGKNLANHQQRERIEERIKTELVRLGITSPTVRVQQTHDMRMLVLGFSGSDSLDVLDKLGVNSDISYEQRI
jgi:hypothetical protein